MKSQVFFPLIVLLLVALLLPAPVTASSTVTLGSGHINTAGEEITVQLVLDEAPNGLAGYNVNLTVDDPRVARITNVNFPSWAALHSANGLTEGKDIRLSAADLMTKVGAGSTDVPLASVTIRGLINGSTTVHITRDNLDSHAGEHMHPTLIDGNITVGAWTNAGTAPITTFSGTPLSGNKPLMVTFTDTSTNTPTAWSWSFGDGSISTTQNPTYTYASAGIYAVSLIATNAEGSNTTTRSGYVTVISPPPVAGFTGTPTSGTVPLTVTFTDSSSYIPTGWAWYFGDENFIAPWDFTTPWTLMTANAGWTARTDHSSVAMPDSSIVLMGGLDSSSKNNVWRSTDNGATWTLMTANAGWTARTDHSSVAMPDGSIVLMGGRDNSLNYKNDVWRSTDNGATWTQMTASAGWTARGSHTSVAMPDGSIVLMGGQDSGGRKNDVWRSTDNGATWTQMTASAGWTARRQHTSVAMPDGSIVLMGGWDSSGFKNDVWRSTDNGATWAQVTANAVWSENVLHTSVAMPDGSIVLMGDHDSGGYMNNVWRSTDNGATWTLVITGSGGTVRNSYTSVAMPDGSIVLMGGQDSSGYKNDVWRLTPASSSVQNPSHTYTAAGTFSVALQAYNDAGYNSTRKTGYVTVTLPPPTVTGITPSTGVNTTSVSITNLAGTNFASGATVKLNQTGFADITGTSVSVISPTQISCTFDLTNKIAGQYNIVVTNSGGKEGMLINGFTVTAPVPIPAFTGTPTSGTAPLNVTFTDQSTGSPTSWNWSFGDGNFSVLRNSSHVYPAAGTYTVSLNATGASGSNTTTRTNYIAVTSPAGSGTAPIPAFTGSPLSGTAPLTVTFTDLSTGSPTSWNWSFGDGNFSTAQNPAYAYTSSGAYTVSLTSTNSAGSNTKTETRFITVAARSQNADMTLNGTSIQTSGGKQSVTVNLTNVNGTVTQPDLNTVIVQNPGSGWSRMELVSAIPVTSEAGNLNVSEISQVVMTTNPLVAALNQTTLGTVTAQISIPMNEMPTGVAIEQHIFEGANTSALTSFQLAATNSNLNINEVAYTVEIKNTAALNANLTGASDPVKLNLSVSHTWVIANGGIGRIKIIRSAEDGTKQVLTTRFLFNDAVLNMDYFEADSPNGLSVFGVAAVSSVTSSGISSGSNSDSSDSFPSQPKSIDTKTPKGTGQGPWTTVYTSGQTHLSQIDIQTIRSIPDLLLLSEKIDSLPQGIPRPDAAVYDYHKIDLYHATNDDINQAAIEFSVSESWLLDQKMTIHDVQLLRYHEKEWEKLPTEYVGKKNGNFIFRAETTGFSYFATALIKNATIVASTEPVPATLSPIVTTFMKNTITPTLTKTPAASPIPVTQEKEGGSIPVFIFGIAGVIIISVSVFLVRRWWIRRQNPSLFRDYD